MLRYQTYSPDEAYAAFDELYKRFAQRVFNFLNNFSSIPRCRHCEERSDVAIQPIKSPIPSKVITPLESVFSLIPTSLRSSE